MSHTVMAPISVTASTRRGLTEKMVRLKLQSRFDLEFFDIQWSPKEKAWVAWYVDEHKILIKRRKENEPS